MPNFVTQSGLAALEAELRELENVKIPESLEEVNFALSAGDLSENAALDAARFELNRLNARKLEIEEILNDYEIIEEVSMAQSNVVHIGSSVKVEYLEEEKIFELKITGVSEADPLNGKISNESPLAQAILGKKVGQENQFRVKNKRHKVKILEILAA